MKITKLLALLTGLVLIISCRKEGQEEISNVPKIEFVSITPTTVKALTDQVILTINYTDGDGDLGENTADVKNLFVTDLRNNVQYSLRVPQLSPTGSNIAIMGELDIKLGVLSLVGEGASEEVMFEVFLNDRSNNKSNVINTQAITVSR